MRRDDDRLLLLFSHFAKRCFLIGDGERESEETKMSRKYVRFNFCKFQSANDVGLGKLHTQKDAYDAYFAP